MTRAIHIAKGKVATIVNEDQVAVNVGSNSGVEVSDLLTIRREVKVTDPDTKEPLGTVSLVRLRLQITLVSDSFSVGTIIDQTPSNLFAGILAAQVKHTKTVSSVATAASESVVYITPGELAVVTRELDDDIDDDA